MESPTSSQPAILSGISPSSGVCFYPSNGAPPSGFLCSVNQADSIYGEVLRRNDSRLSNDSGRASLNPQSHSEIAYGNSLPSGFNPKLEAVKTASPPFQYANDHFESPYSGKPERHKRVASSYLPVECLSKPAVRHQPNPVSSADGLSQGLPQGFHLQDASCNLSNSKPYQLQFVPDRSLAGFVPSSAVSSPSSLESSCVARPRTMLNGKRCRKSRQLDDQDIASPSDFESKSDIVAYVEHKLEDMEESFTFKSTTYQTHLKRFLPRPDEKHRKYIERIETFPRIPTSLAEQRELINLRKVQRGMTPDSSLGDADGLTIKERLDEMLTSLVNKIMFLLVVKFDTWYIHAPAREQIREQLLEFIWPDLPELHAFFREHFTLFIDMRIRHFRDSVARYFRDRPRSDTKAGVIHSSNQRQQQQQMNNITYMTESDSGYAFPGAGNHLVSSGLPAGNAYAMNPMFHYGFVKSLQPPNRDFRNAEILRNAEIQRQSSYAPVNQPYQLASGQQQNVQQIGQSDTNQMLVGQFSSSPSHAASPVHSVSNSHSTSHSGVSHSGAHSVPHNGAHSGAVPHASAHVDGLMVSPIAASSPVLHSPVDGNEDALLGSPIHQSYYSMLRCEGASLMPAEGAPEARSNEDHSETPQEALNRYSRGVAIGNPTKSEFPNGPPESAGNRIDYSFNRDKLHEPTDGNILHSFYSPSIGAADSQFPEASSFSASFSPGLNTSASALLDAFRFSPMEQEHRPRRLSFPPSVTQLPVPPRPQSVPDVSHSDLVLDETHRFPDLQSGREQTFPLLSHRALFQDSPQLRHLDGNNFCSKGQMNSHLYPHLNAQFIASMPPLMPMTAAAAAGSHALFSETIPTPAE